MRSDNLIDFLIILRTPDGSILYALGSSLIVLKDNMSVCVLYRMFCAFCWLFLFGS